MRTLEKLFANTVYLKVFPNRFALTHVESGKVEVAASNETFTTERLLVGNFSAAEEALKTAMKRLYESRWFAPSPIVVVQPMEKTENGLSEVEERVLCELATAASERIHRENGEVGKRPESPAPAPRDTDKQQAEQP